MILYSYKCLLCQSDLTLNRPSTFIYRDKCFDMCQFYTEYICYSSQADLVWNDSAVDQS